MLNFFADKKGLEIKGNAKVKDLPIQAKLLGSLAKEEPKFLEIDFSLSEKVLEMLPDGFPEIKISGSAPAKLYLKFLKLIL